MNLNHQEASTLPKANIVPGNRPSLKGIHLPTINFQGLLLWFSGRVIFGFAVTFSGKSEISKSSELRWSRDENPTVGWNPSPSMGEFFHASDLLNASSYHQPCAFEYGQCICHCSLRTGIWMEGDISSIGRTLRESVPWMFFIENIIHSFSHISHITHGCLFLHTCKFFQLPMPPILKPNSTSEQLKASKTIPT